MGRLKQIDIENFKSWKGKTVIGPFMSFNCIIGPNGSGKSNVMDAVSFAMGERVSSLRVKRLRDLVHGAHVGAPVRGPTRVSLRLQQEDQDHQEDQETVFTRSIHGNSSEYSIDGVLVPHATYVEELEKVGIVTKAQNCLVFQGAVESIALKDPRERTNMFECISQSRELAAEYELKKKALLKAKEDTQFHFNKKKSATVEKKQVSQERAEAQRYQILVDDLHSSRLQLILAELYSQEKGIGALTHTLRDRQQAAAAHKEILVEAEQTVKTCKKEHGRLSREQQHMDKEIRVQEQLVSQCRSQYIKAKVNTSHHMKKVQEVSAALQKAQRVMEGKQQELEESRQEARELERVWRKYESEVQEKEGSVDRDIQLSDSQRERYKELKELSRKQAAVLTQQVEKLHWEAKADNEKMAFDRRRRREVEDTIRNHQTQLQDLSSRAEKLEDYTKSCTAALEEFREQEETLSSELERGRRRSEEVNQELVQVLEQLADAHLDGHESRRQLRRKELLDKLRRLFPDTVFGRLFDLCRPVHKKYQLAVIKVFGHFMNAIVVSTEKVARDCIVFLKEEGSERETFLPIDDITVSPLNDQLREVPGAKMMVDVVKVNDGASQLRKVVQFVCGNALVCESIKDARRVAFDGHTRLKTVALDGTLFSKAGVISGGSSYLQTKAQCWDQNHVMQLKERRNRLTQEIRELMKLRRKDSDLKQVAAHALGAQTRLKYSRVELQNLLKKIIPKCQADVSQLQSDLSNLDSEILMQQEVVEAKECEMKRIRDRIDKMEDLVFGDFCAEIGVDNIRQYEQEHLREKTEFDKKRLAFESQSTRLNARLDYEQGQLEQQKKKLSRMEEIIDREQRAMTQQRTDEETLLAALEERHNKLQDVKQQLELKHKLVSAAKAQLDQETSNLRHINKELLKLQRDVMLAETALEQKHLARHNLLLACKIQSLPITLLAGSLDHISELDRDSESSTVTLHVYDREAELVIDYSSLSTELKTLPAEEDMEPYLDRMKESLSSLEVTLLRATAPNLKALGKLTEVKDKLVEVTEAFEASTIEARKCHQEFEKVKARRLRLFVQCFEHVCVVIDQIYKKICRNSSAQAILSAEIPDEPYLGGINYSCVAPGKRFMSMDNLSGGEKAIAALALLFAIHSFRPAPFFILDEVDAALDNTNIGKVTSFIREVSRDNMQIIVISLKEEFFSKADALQGVYSQLDEGMSSCILTLDLRPYPMVDEDEAEQTA